MPDSEEQQCESNQADHDQSWAIPLGKNGQYDAIVSAEDYYYLRQWQWSFKISDHKHGLRIYARRGGGRGKYKTNPPAPTILMHDLVCTRACGPRPSNVHTADHKNRNSLDNRRGNLQWATRREQAVNRGKRRRWFNKPRGQTGNS